jgi:hypothetical protein
MRWFYPRRDFTPHSEPQARKRETCSPRPALSVGLDRSRAVLSTTDRIPASQQAQTVIGPRAPGLTKPRQISNACFEILHVV